MASLNTQSPDSFADSQEPSLSKLTIPSQLDFPSGLSLDSDDSEGEDGEGEREEEIEKGKGKGKEGEEDSDDDDLVTLALEFGDAERTGRRPTMEDAHIIIENIEDYGELADRRFSRYELEGDVVVPAFDESHLLPGNVVSVDASEPPSADQLEQELEDEGMLCTQAFFAIYDGHQGKRCSRYASKYLHQLLFQDPLFRAPNGCGIPHALHRAFVRFDEYFVQLSREKKFLDGSTAVCALVFDGRLYVANVGDAECMVISVNRKEKRVSHRVLTKIHKPTEPEERARIQEAGKEVIQGRIDGLAVSRALGDEYYKSLHEPPKPKVVSEEPSVAMTRLKEFEDEYIVMGCDGVWETVSMEKSVREIMRLAEVHAGDPKLMAKSLADYAIAQKSRDNVSVIIAKLVWSK